RSNVNQRPDATKRKLAPTLIPSLSFSASIRRSFRQLVLNPKALVQRPPRPLAWFQAKCEYEQNCKSQMQHYRQLVHFEVFAVAQSLALKPLHFLPDRQKSSFNVRSREAA